jgi:hypothetical protein
MQVARSQVAVLILVALMGCGGGDDDEKTEGSSATGAGGAGAIPTEVACGGTACKQISGPGLTTPIAPCCADAFAAKCGGMAGPSCMAFPQPHEVCPSVNSMNFGFSLVLIGCCVDDKCGLTGGPFGTECTDLETLRMGGMPMGMAGAGGAGGAGGGRGMMGGSFFANLLPQPQGCTQ